ncbi:MAG: SMP-30/Gluconolactonase/LRE-like region [Cyanobacteria bacterium RYN_339]|nr:SMP-30/Gluconolactonase/LRE-like region [Cyanobacteria bacterium RYN_339]
MEWLKPDGQHELVLDHRPAGQPEGFPDAFTRDHAGKLVFAYKDVVYRLDNGQPVRIAGGGAQAVGGNATELALVNPRAVAPIADGGQYVADDSGLFHILPDGSYTQFSKQSTSRLAVGKDGALYGLSDGVVAYGTDGAPRKISPLGAGLIFVPGTLVALADGRLLVMAPEPNTLHALDPATGAETTLATFTEGTICGVAQSPKDGSIYVSAVQSTFGGVASGAAALYRIPLGGAKELVRADERFSDGLAGGLAVDAGGRVYFVARRSVNTPFTIDRYDPLGKTFTTIAGANGRVFKGETADLTLRWPLSLALDARGDLLFADMQARQIRRVPANLLAD